jgi:hypothetical protein
MLGKDRLSVVAMQSELLKQVQPGAQQDETGEPYAMHGKYPGARSPPGK